MIEVKNLTYAYPNTDTPALCDLNFSIEQGESIGVVGANGSGKSTLCYALMGLVPHFYHGRISGDLWLDGINVPDASLAVMPQHVGLVFQEPTNQFSGSKMTVEEEIAFGLEQLGVDRATMHDRVDWVTELFDITHLRQRNPFRLSGGQMQRVAIASVIALKPKILVLDEPTSQLDPVGTSDVFSAISRLKAEGVTTVIVEHKTELLMEHCTRLAVMVGGTMVAMDEPSRIFAHAHVREWGIEVPRYCQAYKDIDEGAKTVPTTLNETTERLTDYAVSHPRP